MQTNALSTRTASVRLHDSGVTMLRFGRDAIQTVDDARENLAMAVKAGAPWARPLLVDIRGCQPLPGDVRRFYSGRALADNFLALAIVFDPSPLGQMMSRLYVQVAKPGIPTRLETAEGAALEWLESFAAERSLA